MQVAIMNHGDHTDTCPSCGKDLKELNNENAKGKLQKAILEANEKAELILTCDECSITIVVSKRKRKVK